MTITSIKIANAMVEQLRAELAAAQATIEQMREAQCNQDALHEALAVAIENVGKIYAQKAQAVADTTLRHAYYAGRDVFEAEAAAHRARKQATKEEGK